MGDIAYLSTVKKFLLGSNTPLGFISYFYQMGNYEEGWHKFLIKGGPGTGKSSLMKSVLNSFSNISNDIEIIYCSSDYDSLDGVILNDKKISIVDATAPHVLEPVFPGTFDNTISICDCWDDRKLNDNRNEIIKLFHENLFYQQQTVKLIISAYGLLKNNYDIINKNIQENINKDLDYYINDFINSEFKFLEQPGDLVGKEKIRLLSGVSVGEIIFYKDTVNNVADKIYVIDDQYGPISNNILSILRNKLLQSNVDIITCYCSLFNKDKIDHILIPSQRVALITSNDYHNFDKSVYRVIKEDMFIDYDKLSLNLRSQIKFNKEESKKIIDKATLFMQEAKNIHDELEKYYSQSIDFKLVDNKVNETIDKIKSILNI